MKAEPNSAKTETLTAAVVVPVYRETLAADEELSRRHLEHYLGAYDKFLVAPERLSFTLPGYGVVKFADAFFHSPVTYSALLVSEEFYRAFHAYDYILVYQLDALVFSDRLREWCATGLDYVGAPWLPGEAGTGFVSEPAVGNGGFSLRRVRSFLEVLSAEGAAGERDKYWEAMYAAAPAAEKLRRLPRKILRRLGLSGARGRAIVGGEAGRAGVGADDPGGRLNEDCFWSFRARSYRPDFRIASPEVALRFAFEVNPARCYELAGRRLPFGCHAWRKYDPAFWEPYLLK
ncbi:MAG TPA: DUF5672 family protein [Pyrinomonadaceae bacterium]|nr:DUF5672 family protein [Pyrinomonadaceae bacterium]